MRKKLGILAILAVFLGLVTFPFWRSLGIRHSQPPPNLVLPANQKDCVMPVAYMRSSHMFLLFNWRDLVVRRDRHAFRSFDGKTYNMSLTGTCLGCHNKEQFCDRCHTYMGVRTPDCWNCHIDPRALRGGLQ